jgi:hypothetical protein
MSHRKEKDLPNSNPKYFTNQPPLQKMLMIQYCV